jgi:hypothetical protein
MAFKRSGVRSPSPPLLSKTFLPLQFLLTPERFGRGFRMTAFCGIIPQNASEALPMPARRKSIPSYLPHKQSGRTRAVWYDAAGRRSRPRVRPGISPACNAGATEE